MDETASIMAAHSRRRQLSKKAQKLQKNQKKSGFLGFDGSGTLQLEPDSEDDLEDFGKMDVSEDEEGSSTGAQDTFDGVGANSTSAMVDADDLSVHATAVWCVRVLRDQTTVVSADSLGQVKFWDLRYGTLKQSFSSVNFSDLLEQIIAFDNPRCC